LIEKKAAKTSFYSHQGSFGIPAISKIISYNLRLH